MPIYKTGKTKDGKQGYRVRINYTDANGNYQTKTKIVYGSPEAKLAEQELLMSVDELASSSNITLAALYQKYIEYKRHEVRETSLNKSITILNNHILPELGNIRIDKIDIHILQEWKNHINQKQLSITMKKNIFGEFRALLNYGVRMDYMIKNPLLKLGNFKEVYFKKPQEKLRYYTPAQFKQFIAVAKEHCAEESKRGFYVFFSIAFYTGMRKGEINALKWNDIEGDIIHIRRSVAQKIKGKSILETPPKNKSSYRDIQIPKTLQRILEEHKIYQMKDKHFTEDFRVCGGSNCLGDTNISNHNIQYADEAGLPHITIHEFRHSHASLLANEGINIQEIARRLGHSKIEVTWNTYAHLYPREEERAVKILDNL